MSDPTRYRVANNQAQLTLGGNILAVDPAGPLVTYADYASLKAEVERLRFAEDLLKDENKHLREEEPLPDGWNSSVAKACDLIAEKDKEIARLKAEVERLRKAGDKLVFALEAMDIIMDMDSEHPEVAEWNAAKEGKV